MELMPISQIVFLAVCLIVFSCSFVVLEQLFKFNLPARATVAVCVGMLSAVGVERWISGETDQYDVILLPFVILAVAIGGLLLFYIPLGVARWLKSKY